MIYFYSPTIQKINTHNLEKNIKKGYLTITSKIVFSCIFSRFHREFSYMNHAKKLFKIMCIRTEKSSIYKRRRG